MTYTTAHVICEIGTPREQMLELGRRFYRGVEFEQELPSSPNEGKLLIKKKQRGDYFLYETMGDTWDKGYPKIFDGYPAFALQFYPDRGYIPLQKDSFYIYRWFRRLLDTAETRNIIKRCWLGVGYGKPDDDEDDFIVYYDSIDTFDRTMVSLKRDGAAWWSGNLPPPAGKPQPLETFPKTNLAAKFFETEYGKNCHGIERFGDGIMLLSFNIIDEIDIPWKSNYPGPFPFPRLYTAFWEFVEKNMPKPEYEEMIRPKENKDVTKCGSA